VFLQTWMSTVEGMVGRDVLPAMAMLTPVRPQRMRRSVL